MPRAHPAWQPPVQCRTVDGQNHAAIALHAAPSEATVPTGVSVAVAPSGPKAVPSAATVASARSAATVDVPKDAEDDALSARRDPPRSAEPICCKSSPLVPTVPCPARNKPLRLKT